jgi:hypothetical protein
MAKSDLERSMDRVAASTVRSALQRLWKNREIELDDDNVRLTAKGLSAANVLVAMLVAA